MRGIWGLFWVVVCDDSRGCVEIVSRKLDGSLSCDIFSIVILKVILFDEVLILVVNNSGCKKESDFMFFVLVYYFIEWKGYIFFCKRKI